MENQAHLLDDVAKQAIQDRSVIDHLIAMLGPVAAAEADPRDAACEQSVEIYHQIRKTWSAQR